jgi:integrase
MVEKLYSLPVGSFFRGKELCFGHDLGGSTPEGQSLSNMRLDVLRSIYLRHTGDCKTEASRKPVPLDELVAADLGMWKETSRYRQPGDWIFASPRHQGKYPFWPDAVLQKIIRPAASRRDH